MKVEIFSNNYLPRVSGVAVAVNFLNSSLNLHGHQTLIVAPDYGYGHMVKGVDVFRVKSLYLRDRRLALPLRNVDQAAVREVTENWGPELIHSHHPFGLGNLALEIADERQVPLVYTYHTLYDFFSHYLFIDSELIRKGIREYVLRYVNRADLVITPTPPIKDYLVAQGVTTRVEAVPTGVDFSRFKQATEEEVEELRQKFGLAGFDAVLLSAGRISKEKNVMLPLLALKQLTGQGRDVALLYLGEGPELGELADQAKELKIKDRVIFGGFLDQDTLAQAYFLGDVFMFPSLSDTQGIVLYEAQAAGMPIVATDSMASRAVIRDGQNGLFASDDPADYAAKIATILDDPGRFQEDFDTEAFSHHGIGKVYDRLYREVLAKGRRPDPQETSSLSRLFDEIKALI